jgi:hypothetical protein
MIIKTLFLTTFRHYDEWNWKNQVEKKERRRASGYQGSSFTDFPPAIGSPDILFPGAGLTFPNVS